MIKKNENDMIRSNSKTAVPDDILRQVQQVRRSSQSRDRRYAWLIAASVLAITMIVAMIVEAQLNLFSHSLRFVLTAVSLVATAICGWAFWQRGKQQNERLVTAAEQVDSTFPVLEQRVSTLTSCEEDRLNSKLTAHPAMLNRLAVEATSIHETVEQKPVVSQAVFKRPLCCLAAAGLVMLGLVVWDAPKTMVQLGRFWAPWSNLSVTQVSSVEQNTVMARHEPIKLTAALAGRQVEELQFVSKAVEDAELLKTRLWPSAKDPSVAMFRRSKAVESFDYRFRAGDGQTEWHRVTVADRPKIENLTLKITPPAYTGKPAKTYTKVPKKLRAVQGSKLEVQVTPNAHVRTARLVMGKTDWLPMELMDDRAYEGSMELYQPINFEVQLTEIHGLVNRRPPRCRLQVVSDQAPRVKIVRPTKSSVLLPDETIDIHFKASDDFGIKEMALRVYTQREGEDQPTVHEVPIPLDEERNNRKIRGSVALDLSQFDLANGDTIRYEIRASDNFKPLENLLDETQISPMEGVQLSQNANAGASPDNVQQPAEANDVAETKPAAPVAAEATDQNPQVAQATDAENSNGQTSPNADDASMKNAQAEASDQNPQVAQATDTENSNGQTSPNADDASMKNAQAEAPDQNAQVAQATDTENSNGQASPNTDDASMKNAQADASQAKPASGDASDQNQIAQNSSGGNSNPNNTPASGEQKDDRTDGAGNSEKPPADQMAENPKQEDPSVGENKIGAPQTLDDAAPAETPDPESIAKSDATMKPTTPSESDPAANAANQSNSAQSSQAKPSQPSDSQQANSSNNNPSSNNQSSSPDSNQTAANENGKQEAEKSEVEKSEVAEDKESSPSKSDPVQMAMRSLDVGGQSSSSGQQQIKVDRYAGGFSSEHRNKLEIAIAPVLETLKTSLENAGKNVRRVMNPTIADPVTGAVAVQVLQDASAELKRGSEAVIGLNKKTKDTPYAFVGLRLESIRTADVAPAWDNVREAIDTDGELRLNHSSTAWNHINRALGMLAKLEEKYEQVKRQLKRADDIQKFKKMHRVFIENSLAMLNPKSSTLNGQNRKAVEFDLDEEYLKRLKEVMQMREDMMAELARILADDPQLLRRYMNMMNSRNSTIRDQLTIIAGDQQALAYQVNSWADASKNPQKLKGFLVDETERHLSEIQDLANRLADVQDAFVSWLPLADDVKKGEAAEAMKNFQAAGIELTGMVADVNALLVGGELNPDYSRRVEPLLARANDADKRLAEVSQSLQRMANDQADVEIANNAIRRLPDLQKVRQDAQQWAGKLELLTDGQVNEIYSVNQENRRAQLLEYSVKVASLDSQLAAALQGQDAQLPEEVATKSIELRNILDIELPAQQLIAAQTLSDGDVILARNQQNDIVAKFEQAEKLFDEILQAVADELDKLPVQDPIASLLEDPTLDEILAQLENELDLLERLGLSQPPNNLQVMRDWRSNQMSSMMQQLMRQQQRMRNLSNQAYRNAMARARVENEKKWKPKLAKDDRRWNLLVGELDENMLQGDKKVPPERYRSAIDQYFEKISKLKNKQDSQ